MARLIRIELCKLFSRKRTYIGFGAIVAIVLLVHLSFLWEGKAMMEMMLGDLTKSFYMHGNLLNGYFLAYINMNFLWVHIPVLVVIVTADLFSGEAASGTYRLLLTRPPSRGQVVAVKFIAGTIYTLLLMLLFSLLNLGLGILWFGKGDLAVVMDRISIIPEDILMQRFMIAFAYGFLSMTTIAFLSIMLSAMSDNSLGPILLTMAIIIVMTVITTFNFQVFNTIKPILLTTYLDSWIGVFQLNLMPGKLLKHAGVLVIHCFVFYIFTWFYFRKKDILT